jgi:prepilin-type processing-associated H-X9-DG protein
MNSGINLLKVMIMMKTKNLIGGAPFHSEYYGNIGFVDGKNV